MKKDCGNKNKTFFLIFNRLPTCLESLCTVKTFPVKSVHSRGFDTQQNDSVHGAENSWSTLRERSEPRGTFSAAVRCLSICPLSVFHLFISPSLSPVASLHQLLLETIILFYMNYSFLAVLLSSCFSFNLKKCSQRWNNQYFDVNMTWIQSDWS